ncbi:MAG: sulfatase-like hydrolase/transferase [Gammaproteobacteria bacterium]|jgi:arylsulfatase A-like enzyme|nr:sulfatase-like hydrolase/transferase [Gammaproteobacteria bacterium]MBT7372049.1 sulfatase-like hydrolase/transferase [Gammaproteobacteria bacterium]
MKKPNVLLITADQWRGDCLSSMNHPVVKTPHLDALALESMQFQRHYTNVVPCGPSRASLHTGLYLHNHRSGTNGTPLDERFTNWAIETRNAGYDPVLFGYTHTSMDPRGAAEDDPGLGNDEGILPGIRPVIDMGTLCPDWRAYLESLGYELPEIHGATYSLRNPGEATADVPAPLAIKAEHSDSHYLVDNTLAFIDEFDDNETGWCVHLSLRAPHPPWVAPSPYHSRYPLDQLPEQLRHGSVDMERSVHPWLSEHLADVRNRSHEDLQRHRKLQAGYYGLMSEVDDNIGRLIAALKDSGDWEDTIFIFTSDHGEQMGDHWMYGKAGFFDQSYHIPLIIHCPGVKTGVCEAFTEHVDIFPTLMELTGCEVPRQCDGYSLVPQLVNGALPDWRDAAHFEFDFRHSDAENVLDLDMEHACLNVIRDEKYKYVHFADLPELLFDLEADPGELNNIAPENPEIVARYAKALLSWRMKTTDKTLSHLQISRENGLRDLSLQS